jgi:hypothetical protein
VTPPKKIISHDSALSKESRRTAEMTWGETATPKLKFDGQRDKKVAVSPSRPLNRESIHCLRQWFLPGSEAKQQTD